MPAVVIKELNRVAMAIRQTTEAASAVFAAIQIKKRNVDIKIKSITFGCQVIDSTDRSSFAGQNCFLARNVTFNDSTTFSAVMPVGVFGAAPGAELLWLDTITALGEHGHCDFGANGLILPAGNDYALIVVAPNVSANAASYLFVSMNAETLQDGKPQHWNMS